MEDSIYGKVMPQAVELEVVILGAVMLDKNGFMVSSRILTSEDFYDIKNIKVYEAMQLIGNQGLRIDMLTVHSKLQETKQLEAAGGLSYIMELTNKVGSSANLEYHCHIVKDKSIKRTMIVDSSETIKKCYDDTEPSLEILNDIDSSSMAIKSMTAKNTSKDKSEVVKNVIESISTPPINGFKGLPFTNINELNKMINGLTKGDLVIIGARPSMGKSMLANAAVVNLVKQGKRGLFWGLEMTAEQNLERFISDYSDISFMDISKGMVNLKDNKTSNKVNEAMAAYKSDLIHFEDRTGVNAMEIRSKMFTLKNTVGLDYAIIDHGGLINHNIGNKNLNSTDRIGETTKLLKRTAKELDIPIVLLWQLNRSVMNRGGEKIPTLSDLRGSGNIEEDADKVIFIHRPEYYMSEDGNIIDGETILKIDKCRNGQCGIVKAKFNPDRARFETWENDFIGSFSSNEINLSEIRKSTEDIPF